MSKGDKWLIAGGILLTVGALGTGVFYWAKTQMSLISDFCFKIKGFQFKKFTKDAIQFSFSLDLKNQSNVAVTLKELVVDIYIDKYKITTLSHSTPQEWAKNSVSTLNFDVSIQKDALKIPLEDMVRLGILFVTDKKNFKISYKGHVKVNAMGIPIPKSIPFSIDTNLEELLSTSPTTCKI